FLDIDESEPRVNSLTPLGENHSIAGSYLEKLANGIEPYSPFNISQLMNNSGSNRPIIETIVAHTAEFYWIQIDRARYVVWIPDQRHNPGDLTEWTDIEKIDGLRTNYIAQLSRQRNIRVSSEINSSIGRYTKLLLAKHNLVLTGAPGTGKTFIAKAVAADIVSNGTKDWDTLVKEGCSQIGFVQFHPSYDYTDFVEGLRPGENGEFHRQDGVFKEFCKRAINEAYGQNKTKSSQKQVGVIDNNRLLSWLKQQNGQTIKSIKSDTTFDLIVTDDEHLFAKTSTGTERPISYNAVIEYIQTGNYDREHKTYDPALGQYILDNCPLFSEPLDNNSDSGKDKPLKKKDFVFIIDEINRGELSKIFGELFYSIEPDYRGPKGTVQTQYNNMVEDDDIFKAGFYVPENVYIIGTMNDVDRGVEAMDFAIRRRFGWKEVTAEESAENMGITGLAKVKMDALNKALIEKELTKAHCIGGAYFRKLEGDDFKALWDYHLEGIIFEYFRGEPDAQEKIDYVKDAYYAAKLPEPALKVEESVPTEEDSAE
ncbi:MAG: McrB family protein, partial [Agathobacter sp.]